MNVWRWGGFLLAAGFGISASGQNKSRSGIKIEVPTVMNWTAPIAGEDGRTVMLIRGAKATPSLGSGEMEVNQFSLETYRYMPDGVRVTELLVESPLGRFGPQGAGSGERLTLKSADERFSIAGVGWSWSRATGLLVISNSVETRVRRGAGQTNRPPIEVRARRFEYNLRSGDSRYVGECVAEDPGRARVFAGELRSRLRPTQTEPEAIQGTNGVVIDLLRAEGPGRATGAGATYTAATEAKGERIELNGSTTWRFGPGEGAGDQLILLPGQDAYTASGHARLRLLAPEKSRQSGGPPGAAATPKAQEPVREAIEIACERIEANSSNVVFTGPVIARQGDRLELKALNLAATLGPDPKTLEKSLLAARATGGVTASVGTGKQAIELRGQTMTYAVGEPSLIEVDGEPAWRGQEHSGTAGRFRIHPETQSFEALGDVRARWASGAKEPPTAPVDVLAATMRVDGDHAALRGGVKAKGERWELAAAEVDLGLGTNRTVHGIQARRDVRFLYEMLPVRSSTNSYSREMLRLFGDGKVPESRRWEITAQELRAEMDEPGEDVSRLDASGGVRVSHIAVKARSGTLAYSAADGRFRLSEDAEIRATDGMEIVGLPSTVLTMDPRAMRFGVEGRVRRWRMSVGTFRERASTNGLVTP